MNIKEINSRLKDLGLGFVKMNEGSFSNGKVYTNWEGKRSKGIRGGSIGPMTMTNAHMNHNAEVEAKLKEAFFGFYSYDGVSSKLTFDLGKKTRTYNFAWNLFPSNTNAMDLDPGYQSYWLTLAITDTKK